MRLIIDGYNIIRQIDFLKEREKISLENARSELIRILENFKMRENKHHKITLVFDGKEDINFSDNYSSIEIFYSKGEKADDLIKKIVEKEENKTDVFVATDDKEIKFFVRKFGVKILSAYELIKRINKSRKRAKKFFEKPDFSDTYFSNLSYELLKVWREKK